MFCLWDPESGTLESGIQLKESGIQYLGSRIRGVESRIQDCLGFPLREYVYVCWINGTSQLRTRVSDCGICSRCLIIIKMLCSDLRIQRKRFVTFPEKMFISSWNCRFEESHREMYQNENWKSAFKLTLFSVIKAIVCVALIVSVIWLQKYM